MRKLGYLRVSSRILKRNFYESAQGIGVEQYSEQSRKPLSQQWILKKAERRVYHRCVVSDQPSNLSSISSWLHFLTWMIWYRYLYTKNYKAVYTYHQVFSSCAKSVNTKRENLMVYGVNFTQCICTGYCESWILSSFLLLWTLAIT